MQYLAAAHTDAGTVKRVNQDSLTVKIGETQYGQVAMAVICDGMGGLSQGEVASAHVILAFEEWFYTELGALLRAGLKSEDIRSSWYSVIHDCNDAIVGYGKQKGNDVGTTVTAMLFAGDMYYLIHVGDCRAYEITDKLVQLTKDQTFTAREVAMGHMTEEQALTDPRRNVLLQCVGVSYGVEPDFMYGPVRENATYLLCSDGFRHEILPHEIYQMCHSTSNKSMEQMNATLKNMIQVNKLRGERDNISAIMLRTE